LPKKVIRALVYGALFAVLFVSTIGAKAEGQGTPTPQPTATPVATATPTPSVSPSPEDLIAQAKARARLRKQAAGLRKRIRRDRSATWHWQDVMLARHTRPSRPVAHIAALNGLKHAAKVWHRRRLRAIHKAHNPPYKWAWFCIHSHEAPGNWFSDSNPKYKGGLQFDRTFELMYNHRLAIKKGRANHWTVWEQIWTAVNAAFRHGRGFYPWPNTARMCGLI
jgi:hypothetical protein